MSPEAIAPKSGASTPSTSRGGPVSFNAKHLLGIEPLSVDQVQLILETAKSLREISTRPIKKVPTLRGKTVINLFFEASTRTRTSFEIAAKRLSADAINISTSSSSIVKGEDPGGYGQKSGGHGAGCYRDSTLFGRSAPSTGRKLRGLHRQRR